MERQSISFRSVSRLDNDYSTHSGLKRLLDETKPKFVINCAGFTGKPNVDACELEKTQCLQGNAVLPGVIDEICADRNVRWGHVSSGCIYTGTRTDGSGFTELDSPNFSFRTNNCSFYSGTKALGEECLQASEHAFVWRLRIPFDHLDSHRNFLSKMMRYRRLLVATNSLAHLGDFVNACWQTHVLGCESGIYNVTNTGQVTTRKVVALIENILQLKKDFEFFDSEEQFMEQAAKAPRSNCVLDNSKLIATGIKMRHVDEAIEDSLKNWIWAS